MYKSKFEKDVAKAFKVGGIKFEYEPEIIKFLQPEKNRKYTPDFKVRTKAGTFLIETKGKLTAQDRFKMVWVRDQNPDKKLVLLFMNSNVKLRKGSKTTYGDWARKNNFEFHDFRFGLPDCWKVSS